MTSEIVVMNRTGIAMASDSAATVRSNGKAKLYQADKLFMMSNTQPVGIMVFSNSSLLGVPWEVIIKLFRSSLEDAKLKTLEEFSLRFWSFISDNQKLFPREEQHIAYLRAVSALFRRLAGKVSKRNDAHIKDLDYPSKKPLLHFQIEVALEALAEWEQKPDSAVFTIATAKDYLGRYSGQMANLAVEHFPGANDVVVNALNKLAKFIISKDEIAQDARSGIVIAGYGEDDVFPVMQEFQVGEIYDDKPKYQHVKTWRVSNKEGSVLVPFAQSEMAQTFLFGISPRVRIKQLDEIVQAVVLAPILAIDGFPGVSKKRKDAYKKQLLEGSIKAAREMLNRIEEHSSKEHYDQVLQFVTHLPKNELAHVAASLVNLNSFQKRMNFLDDETVGGPIDVAVISKCDGFVWIARKHYFSPELNSHYFRSRLQPISIRQPVPSENPSK